MATCPSRLKILPIIASRLPGARWRIKQRVHIRDLAAVVDSEFPVIKNYARGIGHRTTLAVPLLRDGLSIGAILIRRLEVRPFKDAQIKLLETFADHAVIAIENARLFQELQSRNRDLTEALEQQTATSEVLQVIANSPTDLQPVLDTVIANAVKLAGAKQGHIRQYDGEFLRLVAHYNETPETVESLTPSRPVPESLNGRAFLERRPIQRIDALVDYAQGESDYRSPGRDSGARSVLAVPLLREGSATGTILIWRDFVQPFTERQVDLVRTFADQAVIAIENVRLFQELQVRNHDLTEALEQQTATSDVLRVITSSPTDVQPVFDAIVRSATRLCEASFGSAHRFDGLHCTIDARENFTPEQIDIGKRRFPLPPTHGTAVGRAILDRAVVHIEDVRADPEYEALGNQTELSFRTVLAVPLLKDGSPIGALGMWRREVKPFTENQVNLVKTFADQAVIAIENVRLFNELKESLEQQTATSEILGVIASSPTDIQPVLDVVAQNAARLCEADRRARSALSRATAISRVAILWPCTSARVCAHDLRTPCGPSNSSTGKTIHVHRSRSKL